MHDATLALRRSLEGCEIVALDSAERAPACTVMTEAGRFFKLSGTAALLVTGVRGGASLEELGRNCATSAEGAAAACRTLAAKLDEVRAAPPRDLGAVFVAHRPWLAAETVRALAAPLSRLCGSTCAIAAGAAALAIVIAALSATPGPRMTVGTFWAAYLGCLPILLVHELGHAAMCIRHGARVGPIGVALYLIYPALYCDVTSAWRLRRWSRVAIDLGGLYFQAIATAGIALAWWATGAEVLFAITAMSAGLAITNLLPFFSLDGYWCLSDALGVVNLRDQRRAVLAGLWARLRGRPAARLPWPAPIALFVAAYSIAALAFGGYVLWRLLPHAGAQLVRAPGYARDLAAAASSGEGLAALSAAGRLATAAIAAILAAVVLRRAARACVRLVRGRSG